MHVDTGYAWDNTEPGASQLSGPSTSSEQQGQVTFPRASAGNVPWVPWLPTAHHWIHCGLGDVLIGEYRSPGMQGRQ